VKKMDYTQFIIPGVIAVTIIIFLLILRYIYKTYNKLVYKRMVVNRQASHIDAHLKKKFDLIPGLTEVVKGYAKHEKGTVEEVTRLRSQWGQAKGVEQRTETANMLEAALSKLLVVQERYPKLKADSSFLNIQRNISHVEGQLLHERKVYNKRVSYYNVALEQFPSNLVGKLFNFKPREFFTIQDE